MSGDYCAIFQSAKSPVIFRRYAAADSVQIDTNRKERGRQQQQQRRRVERSPWKQRSNALPGSGRCRTGKPAGWGWLRADLSVYLSRVLEERGAETDAVDATNRRPVTPPAKWRALGPSGPGVRAWSFTGFSTSTFGQSRRFFRAKKRLDVLRGNTKFGESSFCGCLLNTLPSCRCPFNGLVEGPLFF